MPAATVLLLFAIGPHAKPPQVVNERERRVQVESGPMMPFIDENACPFEGCIYKDWKARKKVDAVEDPSSTWTGAQAVKLKRLFTVRKGETVTAIGGLVVFRRAGRMRIDKSMPAETNDGTVITLSPGDVIYLLTYHGEFCFTAWFKGQLIGVETSNTIKGPVIPQCRADCDGEILEDGQWTWWVNIQNARGQSGWTDHPYDFDGSYDRDP
jgi:hypothetical protein